MILSEGEAALSLQQTQLFATTAAMRVSAGQLAREFGVPPFSILDSRQGYWQDRKREWLALGIRSELGRGGSGDEAIPGGHRWPSPQLTPEGKIQRGGVAGRPVRANGALSEDLIRNGKADGLASEADWGEIEETESGASIFDPVVCELIYHWLCGEGGLILDPFAGGSVRGIVAAYCGRSYLGIDLRAEQVAANRLQWEQISSEIPPPSAASPEWREGDSRRIGQIAAGEKADLLFTCPPYYDLEIYSDSPDDLSRAGSYEEFMDAFLAILLSSSELLADDRFACIVVSEIRDPKSGYCRGFVPDTIRACEDAGMRYYNESILINRVGSLPLRVRRQFNVSRKLGRSHQSVLSFVKGDPYKAAAAAGPAIIPHFGG